MDIKEVLAAGGNGVTFTTAMVVFTGAIWLVFLGAQSVMRAPASQKVFVASFVAATLFGTAAAIAVFPKYALQSINRALTDSQAEMMALSENVRSIIVTGYTAYQTEGGGITVTAETVKTVIPTPGETGTPITITPEATPTATPFPINTIDPLQTPINAEMVMTATPDVAAIATRNAEMITAVPTLDPTTWNPKTPAATPVVR